MVFLGTGNGTSLVFLECCAVSTIVESCGGVGILRTASEGRGDALFGVRE